MSIAQDLRGFICICVFDLPASDWPIPGYPAWVHVLDADMGMLKLRGQHDLNAVWVSTSKIQTLRPSHRV